MCFEALFEYIYFCKRSFARKREQMQPENDATLEYTRSKFNNTENTTDFSWEELKKHGEKTRNRERKKS